MDYYNGDNTLQLKDKRGKQPQLYLITSTRGTGKTTYFGRKMLHGFLDEGKQWIQLIRFKNELMNFTANYFDDVIANSPELEGTQIKIQMIGKQVYSEILVNGKVGGFVIPLNSSEQIRKISHVFSNTQAIVFEEFQVESGMYCPNELIKFHSITTSVGRGRGQMYRYLPIYMLSNPVSVINPYFIELDIADKITNKTKYYIGDGFIVENFWSEDIHKAAEESGINRAFANSKYTQYLTNGKYLNDNDSFIGSMQGQSHYLATIAYDGKQYALRYFKKQDVVYCDRKVDKTFKNVISFTTTDHTSSTIMQRNNNLFKLQIRSYFDNGQMCFADQECKRAVIKYIS